MHKLNFGLNYLCSRAWCLNSSTTLRKRVTVTKAFSPSWVTSWDERGTTIAVSSSYLSHQSWIVALHKKGSVQTQVPNKIESYLGTMTNNVTRYSESNTKCSFFTNSPRFRVTKLPLQIQMNYFIDGIKHKIFIILTLVFSPNFASCLLGYCMQMILILDQFLSVLLACWLYPQYFVGIA